MITYLWKLTAQIFVYRHNLQIHYRTTTYFAFHYASHNTINMLTIWVIDCCARKICYKFELFVFFRTFSNSLIYTSWSPILVIVKKMVRQIYFYTKIREKIKAWNEFSDVTIIGTWHVVLDKYTADTVLTEKEYNSKMDKVVWEFLKMIDPISYYVHMYLCLLDWHILPTHWWIFYIVKYFIPKSISFTDTKSKLLTSISENWPFF